MPFVSKKRLEKYLLAYINASRAAYEPIRDSDASEQRKRDAYMVYSGQVTLALDTLLELRGESLWSKLKRKSCGTTTQK